MKRLYLRTRCQPHEYRIEIDRGNLRKLGELARQALPQSTNRIVIASNSTVYEIYGSQVSRGLKMNGFAPEPWLMGDGERFKSWPTLGRLVKFLNEKGFDRSDAILALGGGVVGDLAGFAASIHLRGISFLLAPTTLLAQIDSSVGGKTGVNLPTGKNVVGAFHQPRLVVADLETLTTLPSREITAGLCEMVKQGAIGNRKLFSQTVTCLTSLQTDRKTLISPKFESLVAAHCRFKSSIVAHDEREELERKDSRSRRILNFGHTVAHALESLTAYRRFRHGEAVGWGIRVATDLSQNLGLLDAMEAKEIHAAVRLCGKLPRTDDLDVQSILQLIKQDKKSVGGQVNWVLLEGIGRARIVNSNDIPTRMLVKSVRSGLSPKEVEMN